MRLLGDFNLLVNFVTRSQQALQDAIDPERLKPLEIPKEDLEKDRDLQDRDLERSIQEADRRGWEPQKTLLRDVQGSVRSHTLGVPEPELANRYEREAQLLPTEQRDNLPETFDSSLGFLRETYLSAQSNLVQKPTTVPGETPVVTPETPVTPVEAPVDPRVAEFVSKLASDGYEAAPTFTAGQLPGATPAPGGRTRVPTEAQFVKGLAPELANTFNALSPETKKFVLTLDPKFQKAFLSPNFTAAERIAFAKLPDDQRAPYVAMGHEARGQFEKVDPSARAAYLEVHPDYRETVRQRSTDGKAFVPTADAKLTELAKREPARVANQVAPQLLDTLGYDKPPAGEDMTQFRTAQTQAASLFANHLQEKPGDVAYARMATMKDLLAQPEFQDKLMGDLEVQLATTSPELADHMLKLRPQLLEHANQLLTPNIDRKTLLDTLAQSVTVSKEFTDAHPPRRRDLRVSPKFKFMEGVRG
ncbi:MAG: hypothetical protein IPJ65_37005 [Archangiaceae bacterium]|nr:hypothetical protein [Archangiaceae bacterium]